MRVTLRVLSGPYSGREFVFDQHDTFLIGRAESAHLYLPEDRFFSRHHCLLEIAPPQCFLRDLGSTNGTIVNGRKVQEAFLRSGDRIQGGQTVLEVEVHADQAAFVADEREQETQNLSRPSIVVVECAKDSAFLARSRQRRTLPDPRELQLPARSDRPEFDRHCAEKPPGLCARLRSCR